MRPLGRILLPAGIITNMIAKKYRFHGYGSMNYLKSHAASVRDEFFTIRYIENKLRKNSRVAVIVSKKITKSAVKRNRIRRRVFESIRNHMQNIKPNVDIVILVNSLSVVGMESTELEKKLEKLLTEAELFSQHVDQDAIIS